MNLLLFVMELVEGTDKKNNKTSHALSLRKLVLSIVLPILVYKILDRIAKSKQRRYKHYFNTLKHSKSKNHEKVEFKTVQTPILVKNTSILYPVTEKITTTETTTTTIAERTVILTTTTSTTVQSKKVKKPVVNTIKPNKCDKILLDGHWKNWHENGFERRTKQGILLKNPRSSDYPLYHKPYFNKWSEQNFTGEWQPEGDCDLHRFKQDELVECFDNGSNGISVQL